MATSQGTSGLDLCPQLTSQFRSALYGRSEMAKLCHAFPAGTVSLKLTAGCHASALDLLFLDCRASLLSHTIYISWNSLLVSGRPTVYLYQWTKYISKVIVVFEVKNKSLQWHCLSCWGFPVSGLVAMTVTPTCMEIFVLNARLRLIWDGPVPLST